MITGKLHPLRLRRLGKGLSQYALEKLSGVPQVKISYAERGYNCLKDCQKEAIANVLGCSKKKLFAQETRSGRCGEHGPTS